MSMKVHVVHPPQAKPFVERVEIGPGKEGADFAITALQYASRAYLLQAGVQSRLTDVYEEAAEHEAMAFKLEQDAAGCEYALAMLRQNSDAGTTTELGSHDYTHIMFGIGQRAARESLGIGRRRSRFLEEYLECITYIPRHL